MDSERDLFEQWLAQDEGVVRFGAELTDTYIANTWEAWQARGKLDAERIVELKQERNDLNYLAMERLHEIEELSLQNQVLREALEEIVDATRGNTRPFWTKANHTLTREPNQDDWIRKSDLEEVAFVVAQDDGEITSEVISSLLRIGTKLYRIKETTK